MWKINSRLKVPLINKQATGDAISCVIARTSWRRLPVGYLCTEGEGERTVVLLSNRFGQIIELRFECLQYWSIKRIYTEVRLHTSHYSLFKCLACSFVLVIAPGPLVASISYRMLKFTSTKEGRGFFLTDLSQLECCSNTQQLSFWLWIDRAFHNFCCYSITHEQCVLLGSC